MSKKEVILEILELMQDLTCMIGGGKDPFISEKLKNTYTKLESLKFRILKVKPSPPDPG